MVAHRLPFVGVHASDHTDITLHRNQIHSNSKCGVVLSGQTTTVHVTSCEDANDCGGQRVTENTVDGNGFAGISITGIQLMCSSPGFG